MGDFKRQGDLGNEGMILKSGVSTPLRTMEVMVLFKESVVSVGLFYLNYVIQDQFANLIACFIVVLLTKPEA